MISMRDRQARTFRHAAEKEAAFPAASQSTWAIMSQVATNWRLQALQP